MSESLTISVIIPVYNVEEYLEKCLESVVNQTYKNLEIICIDDTSTDESLSILEKYAKNDNRFTIIKNSQNLGLGLTRNEGIKIASGQYIHFLDSDDWMEHDAYEILSQYFESGADVIKFNAVSHDEITKKLGLIGYTKENYLLRKLNIFNEPECFQYFESSAWSKIYRREFIMANNLLFNDHRCFEDIEYAMNVALKAENLIFIENKLLNYRLHRKNSLLQKKHYHINDLIEDVKCANNNTSDCPYNVRSAILNYVYQHLILNSADSYYYDILPYKKMKEIFTEYIDAKILEDNEIFNNKLAYNYYKKAMKYNHFVFFMLFNTKMFIKIHFPEFTKLYFKIKKGVLHAN